MSEQEEFLKSTEVPELDVFEQNLAPESSEKSEEVVQATEEKGDITPRNRRERRLMERLAEERESSSFLAGKLEARTEASKSLEEDDYLKSVERIYGTDTPEAQLATDLLKKALVGMRDDAQERAYQRIVGERQQDAAELSKAESELDSFVDEIEEEYSVTLTDAQERAYFTLMERMSPKDRQGNVVEYADPHAVWEVFQERLARKGGDTRAKDLSSRSMVNSSTPKESKTQDDASINFLKEHGII